jgi:pimeloyl-ACP methyl ester carboxylesterase
MQEHRHASLPGTGQDISNRTRDSRRLRRIVCAVIAGSTATIIPTIAFADSDDEEVPRCAQLSFQVSLAEGQPADSTVAAWLCTRGSIDGRTIQVLLHGATYDHNYWDFPLMPEQYSYVRAATKAGYATLNLDCLGSGSSSHPDPDGLTLDVAAFAVHQIIGTLRNGSMVVPDFGRVHSRRVMLVGHSLGSYISAIEASRYDDVDGVILSGYSHTAGPGIAVAQSSVYPGAFDPKFAGLGLPFDYLTTLPGTRGAAFYDAPLADPSIIAEDEQLKQTVAVGELIEVPSSYPASLGIQVPTLVADGDFDSIDCNAPSCSASGTLANEASNFGPAACVEVVDIPSSGHDLNLHRNAPVWFGVATSWADRHVGPHAGGPPVGSCP